MVKERDYSSVPTTAELENNSNQKKYTINRIPGGRLEISKTLCALLVLAALLLAVLVGVLVYCLAPSYCKKEAVPQTEEKIIERLPRSIEPTHYRIQLIPDLQNSTISGAVTITLNPLEETDTIIFHAKDIEIHNHSVSIKSTQPDSTVVAIKNQEYLDGDRYKVVLNERLQKGVQYQLETKYTGKLNNHLQGFYKSKYNDSFENERFLASTQFAPNDARRAFPCFDEPSFKTKFTISVARPFNMTSLSNMPRKSTDISPEKDSTYWDHYPETPKIPTYLTAFVISDLKQRSVANYPMQIWTRDEFLTQTGYASNIAPKLLQFYQDYFGIKYPLPKIDIVALPDLGYEAMENWGLITVRESDLLYSPNASTDNDKRRIATVLSHEIAHQWFGNLVTPMWWDDLWLNEGFATYLQYIGANYVEPDLEILSSDRARAMAVDALESSRPLSYDVKNNDQIREIFDGITYAKGACIIRMMRHFLGEDTFKNGIINFLKKHQNGNADRQDLFTALTEEARRTGVLLEDETVYDIMEAWTQTPGFPVITATANYDKNELHISQKRFYLNGKDEKSSWWVPLSFTTSKQSNFSNTKPKFWLRGEEKTTENVVFDTWYLLNLNETGYFIVNYDEKNWRSLSDHLMMLPEVIRAQLISDSMELARANLLAYDIPLKMIAKAAVQDKGVALAPTVVSLDKLKILDVALSASAAYGNFQTYHESIFRQVYEAANFNDQIDDYKRSSILEWSCRNPVSRCAQEFMVQFRNVYHHNRSVKPILRSIVYCTGVRNGNEQDWEVIYQKLLYTHSPNEKNLLLDALGCTNLRWLLSRYINMLLDSPNIRIQDANRIFDSVARNPVGTPIAFDFLRQNWNELLNRYGDGFNVMSKMVTALATNMNTEFQLIELEEFRDTLKGNISTTTFAFENTIATVKANIEWMKKNYHQVESWLSNYKEHYAIF